MFSPWVVVKLAPWLPDSQLVMVVVIIKIFLEIRLKKGTVAVNEAGHLYETEWLREAE